MLRDLVYLHFTYFVVGDDSQKVYIISHARIPFKFANSQNHAACL